VDRCGAQPTPRFAPRTMAASRQLRQLSMLLACSLPHRASPLTLPGGFTAPRHTAPAGFSRCAARASVAGSAEADGNALDDDDDENDKPRRKFELCQLDEEFNIDECEVIYDDDLSDILGAEQAARIMSDPTAVDVFFRLPDKVDDEAASEVSSVLRERAELQSQQQNRTVFTMADWEVCLQDDLCEVPDDVLNRALGPDQMRVIKERVGGTPEEEVDSRFHLHFGAGRLGLGLVVPAISASGVSFAVVQRPKPRWRKIFQKGLDAREDDPQDFSAGLEVTNNDEVVVHNVKLISADGDKDTPTYMPPKSLIFGSTPDELRDVMQRATSFSCSLGAAMARVLVPLMEELPKLPLDQQPLLFCCENDHAAVMKLKAQLEDRVFVVDCMVDRVCTGREISETGVDVQAEPWRGSIVVLEPNISTRVPFCSKVATVPSSTLEAAYLSERKLSLVNGMHTVLAFMTLRAQYEPPVAGEQREYILLKYDEMSRQDQRMCEAWRTARAAQLIQKYGSDKLMGWHEVGSREEAWDVLLEFADYVLSGRFSQVDDVVSRVLGGGVANRWLMRLRPTDQWMQMEGASSEGAGGDDDTRSSETRSLLLYALNRDRERAIARGGGSDGAGAIEAPIADEDAAEAYVAAQLSELTMESRRFCARELEITHKTLIREQRKAGGKKFSPLVQSALEARNQVKEQSN